MQYLFVRDRHAAIVFYYVEKSIDVIFLLPGPLLYLHL